MTDCTRCTHRDRDAFGKVPIGMSYVPWQVWREIYKSDVALRRGTIFSQLDLPFGRKREEDRSWANSETSENCSCNR